MSIKIHPEICNHCNIHFLIDRECGGDYHPSVGLQWWCPECGQMKPLLSFKLELSNREKKRLAQKFAREYNLPFPACEKQAKEIFTDDEYEFIKVLKMRLTKNVRAY